MKSYNKKEGGADAAPACLPWAIHKGHLNTQANISRHDECFLNLLTAPFTASTTSSHTKQKETRDEKKESFHMQVMAVKGSKSVS